MLNKFKFREAAVLVDAGRVVGAAAVTDRDLAVFEVADELVPFLIGWCPVFLAGALRAAAGEESPMLVDHLLRVDGLVTQGRGYRLLCVTDSRCNLSTRRMMEALGSYVHIVTEPDPVDGFLGARINYVRDLCAADERYVWLNQYTNPGNWKAHYHTTAPAIAAQFPSLDVLFVGAGTTGTLMGCARYFAQWHRPVRIVAVDSVGSVSFGGIAGRRMIPGLGTSVTPPLLDESYVDEVVRVAEADTIRACHRLARSGFLFGGSTGTLLSGAMDWLTHHHTSSTTSDITAVGIAPDLGERYLDTVYQTNWVEDLYGPDILDLPDLRADENSRIPPTTTDSLPHRRCR